MKSILENRIIVTSGTLILVSIFLFIEHLKGGVVTHHLLAREDLPGISNWWGLLTVSLLAWSVATLIQHRKRKAGPSEQKHVNDANKVLYRFLAALAFGIAASVLWELKLESVLQYFILLPILISFFKPVHLPEYLLGFVLGMMYSFGGILPIIVGLVLLMISFLIHSVIRILKRVMVSKGNK
ncbi:MAG: hypothetical protein HKP49_07505 [Maribacter sp.]|nr:hypothetical protein [Maribacter sp.]